MKLNIVKQLSISVLIAVSSVLGVLAPAIVNAQTNCLTMGSAQAHVTVSGNQALATFHIPAECGHQIVSFVSYKAPALDGQPRNLQTVFQSTTQTLHPGSYQLSIGLPDCFYQVDLVRGEVIQHLSDSNDYMTNHSLLAGKHGGDKTCTTTTQTPPPVTTPPAVQSATTPAPAKSLPNTGAGSALLISLSVAGLATLLHANRRKLFGRS